jgi:cytoskeleton protein RodZ
MDDLGIRLKRAREARGLALKDLAAKTKLSISALDALERCEYARLPGGIFGRSFVRAYALEVGIDPDPAVVEFVEVLEKIEAERAARRAVRPEVTADDRAFLERQRRALLALQIALAVLALVAILLIGWQVRSWWQRSAAKRDAIAAATTAATSAIESGPASSDQPAVTGPKTSLTVPAATPVSLSTVSTAPPSTTGPLVLTATEPLVIDFDLSAECWVSVTADGRQVRSELMPSGTHARFEAMREVVIDVGNAGAVTWMINGRRAQPLGRNGVHVRTRIGRDNAAGLVAR